MADVKNAQSPRRRAGAPWLAGFPLAVQFLTVLPVPVPEQALGNVSEGLLPDAMAPALAWFPVVGGLIGALLVGIDWALAPWLTLGVRDAILLAVPALLTGMLHLDGFVDCCDALLGTRGIGRRMEILHDSRVGAYGALGAALLLIAMYAALGALTGVARPLALVLAPTLGRWGIVFAIVVYPYARSDGLGSFFRGRRAHLAGATLAGVAVAAVVVLAVGTHTAGAVATLTLAAVAFVALLVWTGWASRRLGGGLTGDTYGAANEIIELAVLVAAPVVVGALETLHSV